MNHDAFIKDFVAAHEANDYAAIESFYLPDAIWHVDLGTSKVRNVPETLITIGTRFSTRRKFEDLAEVGDKIAIRWTEFAYALDQPPQAPDAPPVHYSTLLMILRVSDGKIAEQWVARDLTYYLKVLGW